ncbi:glycerol-3-phosphate acyltransferase PlsY [Spiroplasma syrphidicola EA-1]|uniref:Glycerol-3-phosphate acyltransferase n=1 Tax=Spiroplasma syrphidicola EA-1 TaxID=1276229 RepID=R4UE34_9MOLU|nr:glycerol-3-phosphate 1-O-acyltransferase PlsY [Spiroplasma syrphidicola]AGM26149.1 glycerol-3-phosphate acyltransferase PlsY [Spiroplasma syrphidicola EA-1]
MEIYGIIGTIIGSIIAYLIGSFSWSILISKLMYKVDVRDYYSKNAGATNTTRVLGKKWGLAVTFLDMGKVIVTMFIVFGISCININGVNFGATSYYIPAFFVLVGHCYPIYYRFKGGKTVASFGGLLLMANPYLFLIAAGTWWITIFIWKRVSVSSILAVFLVACLCWVPQISGISVINFDGNLLADSKIIWFNQFHHLANNYNNYYDSLALINIVIVLGAILSIARHHENIARLLKGTEPKFDFKKKSSLATGEISRGSSKTKKIAQEPKKKEQDIVSKK